VAFRVAINPLLQSSETNCFSFRTRTRMEKLGIRPFLHHPLDLGLPLFAQFTRRPVFS
jgi:hypothetical protein